MKEPTVTMPVSLYNAVEARIKELESKLTDYKNANVILAGNVAELEKRLTSEHELRSAFHALADTRRAYLLIKGFGEASISDADTWPTPPTDKSGRLGSSSGYCSGSAGERR